MLYRFFVLPSDAEDFKLDLAQNPNTTYIRKPAASSRGRGIRVVKDPKALDLSALNDVILQHYIPNPLLIGGRKFDLRVYVAVTCLDPLRVYVYREGEEAAFAPYIYTHGVVAGPWLGVLLWHVRPIRLPGMHSTDSVSVQVCQCPGALVSRC